MKTREKNLDVLRVLAAFMVILLHVSAVYVIENIDQPNLYFTIGNFFDSISRVGVPIFVMLSGAFILDNDGNKDYKKFYKKMFLNIIIPTLIWSLLYFFYSITKELLAGILIGHQVNYFIHIKNWINGAPFSHLWYMYMVVGLYIVAPVLIRIKTEIGEKSTFKLGIYLTFLGVIIRLTSNLFWLINFIPYLGYFILGYSLRKYYTLHKKKPFKYLLGWIVSSLCVFGVTEIIVRGNYLIEKNLYFYGTLSPFVIIGALFLFIAFLNMQDLDDIYIDNLAKHTFNIYLIHAGVLNIIDFIKSDILHLDLNPIWYIPLMTVIVFLISYWGSLVISRVMKFNISTRIINKIQNAIL